MQIVDTARYPLAEPGSDAWERVVSRTRTELRELGCSVLPEFILPSSREALRREGAGVAPLAYYDVEETNVYNIAFDDDLPAEHPGRIVMQRGNAFVARDRIPTDSVIHRLYIDPSFVRFVAACFELPELHELADPLSGLVLNVVQPGMEHPWHFDTNEFTVSMLTQEPEEGGVFEYCPNIRSAGAENFGAVRSVLTGADRSPVRALTLRPGDLQLFKGRYALHRVSAVRGATARHSAIFAYSERPGVMGSVARTRQLFGRVLPAHRDAERNAVRVDQLLD
ncbi:2OG-Fe(II) oxygenase superfamily protein [Micromonospora purpureochromogenes]|uniref:2OG-Fe(II) oxygenase superfamily protein n=1 Tax=Micromonospora purpureochromogenes TaxID=47872 RepID=A0A1C4ZSU0_9ACTN|nr:arpA protein [Micromonospora purpureochromogenes]SCF36018.1 2OG-Fe(II) oxygenase superfamily protein [Micromonospora purpureochromogenes]